MSSQDSRTVARSCSQEPTVNWIQCPRCPQAGFFKGRKGLNIHIVYFTILWADAHNSRQPRQSYHGHGWDIRLAVPGEPGSDYPTLGAIPRTSFSCAGKTPGYYADIETSCQVFRICTAGSTYGFQSFLCPNGTLFNQAVFVCDWWMNVNCQRSQELFNNNNDKFGNLKLGPQLMKDIKKMLTHSMRNPYDKFVMKSNLIVMQDYQPPFGQMFPNGALMAGAARTPNSLYFPAKQVQFNQNVYDNENAFAASTPSPRYVPAPFNTISPTQSDAEVFQRQRQYHENNRIQSTENTIPNGHAGQFTQSKNTFSTGFSQVSRPDNFNQVQYTQKSTNNFGKQSLNAQNAINSQLRQPNGQNGQYTESKGLSQSHNRKQLEFGVSFSKEQYNHNSNQEKQRYTNKSPIQLSNENTGVKTEAKHLSNDVPATIVTKSLTFNRIVDPKPGNPKSRITFKTWIVKPKAARLTADPTAYTYDRPTNPPTERLVVETTPYIYNPPTTVRQRERIASEPDTGPYVYNNPTVSAKQVVGESPEIGPYMYNKPTVAAKQIREPPRLYLTPTVPSPTLSGRLYLAPTPAPPTLSSRLYLAPTTYKPSANLIIAPSQTNLIIPRQYLVPSTLQQPAYYQSEQLRASPTSPSPVYVNPPTDNPSFSLVKHSRINTNHNNLTFADILTKEKLDITVNDIVSDTSKVLKTASPQHFGQYRQAEEKLVDYSENNYMPSDSNNESDENLTPQSPTVASTSARLVENPSIILEPPVESYNNKNEITNRLSNLPFLKESGTNTIERTVSLKISIPEKVATYLFMNSNESNHDKLEILNTGSSNYLVLTNNLQTKNTGASFIPIGRLISDKTSNISDSQALVFSLLADSINVAKEYGNIAQQNLISPGKQTQTQNLNNEDLSRITNQISQLTASQYSGNQNINFNHGNIVATSQTTTSADNPNRSAKYTNSLTQNQIQQNQRTQVNSEPSQQTIRGQSFASRYQNSNNEFNSNLLINPNQNQMYSGQLYQLPVPDVTSHIYNAGSENLVQSNARQQNLESKHLLGTNQNGNVANNNNSPKQSSAEVEIVQSQTLPLGPAAKLQLAPSNEAETFNSQEHSAQALNFLNNGNGISAQLRDKIVGTIPHPLEENKLVTYKKDQSYYVYTKLNNNAQSTQSNTQSNNQQQQNAKLIQNNNIPDIVTFQLVPSVSYQLEDEKEQQKILNAFQIDEFGNPKKIIQIQNNRQDFLPASEVDYSVEHPKSAKLLDGRYQQESNLYNGPSSYSAPQASVGNLQSRGEVTQNNINARLEQFEDRNGYRKVTPARQFSY